MEPITALAGATLFGSMFNSASAQSTSRYNTERTIQANKELAEYAYQKDLEMWNRANEYNMPVNQMARLKEANLNPHLVYGSGSVVGNTSTQTPQYHAPRVDYDIQPFQIGIAPAIEAYTNMYLKSAQKSNLEAQNSLIAQQAIGEAASTAMKGVNTAKTQFDLNLAKKLEQTSLETAEQNLKKIQQDIVASQQGVSESQQRERAMRIDNELNEALKKYGVTSQDSVWIRALIKNLAGINLPDFSGKGFESTRRSYENMTPEQRRRAGIPF